MVIKDWKKTDEYQWDNEEKDGRIWLTIGKKMFWTNIAYFRNGYWSSGKTKQFKTKSQALKYARAYMRKH